MKVYNSNEKNYIFWILINKDSLYIFTMKLLLLTILPSLAIVALFVISDRFREPTKEIIKVFIYGILITIPAFYFNTYLADYYDRYTNFSEALKGSFLSAGPVEEGLKLMVLYFFVYKMKDFNEPIDGIVYGVTASLGFATLENLYYVYLLDDYFKVTSMELAVVRSFSAVPAHAAFGIVMGYFFMRYAYIKKQENLILAFLVPAFIHSIYNYYVVLDYYISFALIIFTWIFGIRMFLSLRKKQLVKKREYEKKL